MKIKIKTKTKTKTKTKMIRSGKLSDYIYHPGKKYEIIDYHKDGTIHSKEWRQIDEDGKDVYLCDPVIPTYTKYTSKGELYYVHYYDKDGKPFREGDKPSCIYYHKNGQVHEEFYHLHNYYPEREDPSKPATIEYNEFGKIVKEEYWKDGKIVEKEK